MIFVQVELPRAMEQALAIALVLTMATGCGAGIKGQDVVRQVEAILAQSQIPCDVSATFQGVGEGDADAAYALVRLETAGSSEQGSIEVETLLVRSRRGWKIEPKAAEALRKQAITLCARQAVSGRFTG